MYSITLLAMTQELDPVLIMTERWWFIAFVVFMAIGYLISMDIRRFLAVVMLNVVFQLMWESINIGTKFPYFSLVYYWNPKLEFYIINVPLSSIFLKSIVYGAGSYFFASTAGRKYINSKVDLVKDRGKKTTQHVLIGLSASVTCTLALVAVEPLLTNGDKWILGNYEYFLKPLYFGVDPMYFMGVLLSTMVNFTVIGLIESRIGFKKREVALFDYEKESQSPKRYQKFNFVVFTFSLFVPSLIGLTINPSLGLINFLIVIPTIYIFFMFVSFLSAKMDKRGVNNFCKKNPSSFVCRM